MANSSLRVAFAKLDRLTINASLIALAFASVLVLKSQSGASWFTYLLLLVCMVNIGKWVDVIQTRIATTFIVVLGYFFLSCFWSEPFVWRDVVSILGRCLILFAFAVTFAECQWRGYLHDKLCEVVGGASALAATFAIYFYILEPPPFNRLLGLGQLDNNVVAGVVYAVAIVMLTHVMVYKPQNRYSLFCGVTGVAVLLIAVALTGSRNAWACLSVGICTVGLLRCTSDFRTFFLTFVLFGIVSSCSILFAISQSGELESMILPRGDSLRIDIWMAVIDRIEEVGWIFGGGINTSDDFSEITVGVIEHAHNLYLSIILQGGIVALLLVGLLEFWVIRTLAIHFESQDAKLALAISCMALIFYIFDGHEYIDKIGLSWLLIWLPVGVALGLEWRYKQWSFASDVE